MLVITRKVGENLVIGEDIVITVVETQRGRIRLGVQAPPNVIVLREELLRRPPPEQAPGQTRRGAESRE